MSDDDYVHDPDAFDEDGERVDGTDDPAGGGRPGAAAGSEGSRDTGLGERQGWLVVGLVSLCFVVAPLVVYFWPPGFLGFENAYMAAAMVPGLVLGLVGLWAVAKGRG